MKELKKPTYWQRRELWSYEAHEKAAAESIIRAIPHGLRPYLVPQLTQDAQTLNSWPLAAERTAQKIPNKYIALDDQAICDLAERLANHCLSAYARGIAQDAEELLTEATHYIPQILKTEYIGFPPDSTPEGRVKRCLDPMFWRRKLRVIIRQAREMVHINMSLIGAKMQKYCSNDAVIERNEQLSRLDFFLAGHQIVDRETGECFSLADTATMYEKVYARMMNRLNGVEKYAKIKGHKALFITLTLAEFYHANPTTESSWAGYSPKEGQMELARRWRIIQNRLNKMGIEYGFFRVTEPHQDGCPHWHVCLWCDPSRHWEVMGQIYPEFQDGKQVNKKGEIDYWQVKVSIEDASEGNSASYMCKYVTKNTSNKMDNDDPKKGVEWSKQRVDSWRACWGIYAFRFGGNMIPTGAIGQFDELQRLDTCPQNLDLLIWSAVEERDFCLYLLSLEGERRIKYALEPAENNYDEPSTKRRGLNYKEEVTFLSREPGRYELTPVDARINCFQESKGEEEPQHFGVIPPKIPIGHPLDDWLTDLY